VVIVQVSITPIGTANPSVSQYVAACHEVLRSQKDLRWQLTPMGTIIEGELQRVLEVIAQMHEVPFDKGAVRVSTLIKIDDRRDKQASMEAKVRAVEDRFLS